MRITRRCPRCGQIPATIMEVTSCGMWFDVDRDGTVHEISLDAGPLDAMYVKAICFCGHEWKLRGIVQITDLDGGV